MPLVALAVLLVPVAVCFRQFRSVHSGRTSRRAGILRCAAFSVLPVLCYLGVFLGLIGLEELTGTALIGEGFARTLPLVAVGGIGMALAVTLVLTMLLLIVRRPPG